MTLRGQTLADERDWGDMNVRFVGAEPEDLPAVAIASDPEQANDEPPHHSVIKDMLKGAVLALIGVFAGVGVGLIAHFYF